MKSIINRRGSKAATRAMKRFGTGTKNRTRPSAAKTEKTEAPSCKTCGNAGWETMGRVAACNCCENHKFYTPAQKKTIDD